MLTQPSHARSALSCLLSPVNMLIQRTHAYAVVELVEPVAVLDACVREVLDAMPVSADSLQPEPADKVQFGSSDVPHHEGV